jgi:hypothetical protein
VREPHNFMEIPPGTLSRSHGEDPRIPLCFWQGDKNKNHSKINQSLLHNKVIFPGELTFSRYLSYSQSSYSSHFMIKGEDIVIKGQGIK